MTGIATHIQILWFYAQQRANLQNKRQPGQGSVEYALLLVVMMIVGLLAMTVIGDQLGHTWGNQLSGSLFKS